MSIAGSCLSYALCLGVSRDVFLVVFRERRVVGCDGGCDVVGGGLWVMRGKRTRLRMLQCREPLESRQAAAAASGVCAKHTTAQAEVKEDSMERYSNYNTKTCSERLLATPV